MTPPTPRTGPYVAELYSSFEDSSCVYLIMEYCEGGDLFKTMLMHGGVLEEQWVCIEVRVAPVYCSLACGGRLACPERPAAVSTRQTQASCTLPRCR